MKVKALLSGVICLMLLSGCGLFSGGEEGVKYASLTLSEFAFKPDTITVKTGEMLDMLLVNHGTEMHEMVLQSPWAEFEYELAPATYQTLGVRFHQAGVYDYVCELRGHLEGGMRGQIVVGKVKPNQLQLHRLATEKAPHLPTSEGEPRQEVQIELTDHKFTPNLVEVTAGTLLEVTLTNPTTSLHEMALTIGGMELELKVEPGDTKRFGLKVLQSGVITFVCDQPGHLDAGMKGTLIVR